MIARRSAPGLLLLLLILTLSGCSLLSGVGLPRAGSTQVPIQLVRCGAYPAALCLDSFGSERGELLITFYFPAAGTSEFFLKVWQGDAATTYPCSLTDVSPTSLYCTGPLIPLGTPIKVDLYTKTGRTPLAEGEFTLNGLALPTSGPAGTPASVPLQTSGPAGTPTSVPLQTNPLPGTAYPNPPPP